MSLKNHEIEKIRNNLIKFISTPNDDDSKQDGGGRRGSGSLSNSGGGGYGYGSGNAKVSKSAFDDESGPPPFSGQESINKQFDDYGASSKASKATFDGADMFSASSKMSSSGSSGPKKASKATFDGADMFSASSKMSSSGFSGPPKSKGRSERPQRSKGKNRKKKSKSSFSSKAAHK